MFVKSLRLAGFKSFADPTVLGFEPGVNVIVGPNGSGKSNIADALSWVLGSQAPSTLRGASMEDVIFAGSRSRPRLAFAEVELVLDNSSRLLPIDVSEVGISRSTDRAGASEYRINGVPCRLLDITELLSDTGVGRSLHTMVGQGQLDAVLQARPEERRAFIEEAAQVGKYRRRKDRSLRKLERVEDNILRLNDVLAELRRALRPLKRQAGAAALYSELMIEHRDLRQRLAATEIHRLAADEVAHDPAAEDHRVRLLSEELSTVRARLDSAGADRAGSAAAADGARATAHGLARTADRIAALGRLAAERAATAGARLAAETEEGYRERIKLLEAELDRWSAEAATLEGTASAARSAAGSAAERSAEAGAALSEAEGRLAARRSAETAAAEALVRSEGSEAAGRATLDAVEARAHAAEERRAVTARELAAEDAAIASAEREIAALEADLDRAAGAGAAAEARLEAAREKVDELRRALGRDRARRAASDARVGAFEEVIDLFPGRDDVSAAVGPLLAEARRRAALASTHETDAAELVASAEAEVEERWLEVSRHDQELRRLDALLAGAAERLAGARRRHESRSSELAARDEELARAKDAIAAARRTLSEQSAALPRRRGELSDAARARAEAEEEVGGLRRRVEELRTEAARSELERRGAEERHLAARLRAEEAEAGIADARAALVGIADRRSALEATRRRLLTAADLAAEVHAAAIRWLDAAESRAVEAREEAAQADRKLASLRARERELDEQLEHVRRRRSDAEIHRAEVRARMQALGERAMDEWGLTIDDLKELETFRPEEETDARDRIERLDREMRRIGAVNPKAAEEYEELAGRERFLVGQIEDLQSSRRDLLKIVRDVDETIVQVFSDAFERVASEFETVFLRLFPGGEGRISLTDPSDLLTTGIEIEARPAGKNVRKLSLLSGGERSLVALAFLFAIFRAHPSPFYLLDEVEAALDDVNLVRFLSLIEELEDRAQVLVVTHQKRTMESADVLYGVTMGGDGVSTVVAKRMAEAAL